jgi:phosphoribosylformylglycinamidine synthase
MTNYSAEVIIVLRDGILDAQGKAVENSLHSLEFNQLSNVRVGKAIYLTVAANDIDEANKMVETATEGLLANTTVEEYTIQIRENLLSKTNNPKI